MEALSAISWWRILLSICVISSSFSTFEWPSKNRLRSFLSFLQHRFYSKRPQKRMLPTELLGPQHRFYINILKLLMRFIRIYLCLLISAIIFLLSRMSNWVSKDPLLLTEILHFFRDYFLARHQSIIRFISEKDSLFYRWHSSILCVVEANLSNIII